MASSIRFGLMGVALTFAVAAFGQEQSYWLQQGGKRIEKCPGEGSGRHLKAANRDGQWILITGDVICKDGGDHYTYYVNHLAVEINSQARERVERDQLHFDWIGLAVYRPEGSGKTINWLYDDSFPLSGSLSKDSTDRIYFGRITFDVPRDAVEKATNLQFYLTSEGILYTFEFLPFTPVRLN